MESSSNMHNTRQDKLTKRLCPTRQLFNDAAGSRQLCTNDNNSCMPHVLLVTIPKLLSDAHSTPTHLLGELLRLDLSIGWQLLLLLLFLLIMLLLLLLLHAWCWAWVAGLPESIQQVQPLQQLAEAAAVAADGRATDE